MLHSIGALTIDVDFCLRQPWTILFGPSGSGKSTILRAIAGFVRPASARISWTPDFGDTANALAAEITAVDSGAHRFVPAYRRRIPLAAQRANLFPHMTVTENVGFSMGPALQDRLKEIDSKLALFRITHLKDKLPAALSGGEAQRVNLARAAAAAIDGGILLLDEPFSGLDLALSSEIMADLHGWAVERRICVLSVTHDAGEAFQLGAEVIKIANGRVLQQGAVAAVLAQDRARLLEQLNAAKESPA